MFHATATGIILKNEVLKAHVQVRKELVRLDSLVGPGGKDKKLKSVVKFKSIFFGLNFRTG